MKGWWCSVIWLLTAFFSCDFMVKATAFPYLYAFKLNVILKVKLANLDSKSITRKYLPKKNCKEKKLQVPVIPAPRRLTQEDKSLLRLYTRDFCFVCLFNLLGLL